MALLFLCPTVPGKSVTFDATEVESFVAEAIKDPTIASNLSSNGALPPEHQTPAGDVSAKPETKAPAHLKNVLDTGIASDDGAPKVNRVTAWVMSDGSLGGEQYYSMAVAPSGPSSIAVVSDT